MANGHYQPNLMQIGGINFGGLRKNSKLAGINYDELEILRTRKGPELQLIWLFGIKTIFSSCKRKKTSQKQKHFLFSGIFHIFCK